MFNFFKKTSFFLLFLILIAPFYKVRCEEGSIEEQSKKTVYLTFDDGPGGKATLEVLDTLQKENVPATFFIIGNQICGQENTILRMKNEGHSLGLHSFSHDRNILYRSNGDFINEMKKCQDELFRVTGDYYTILRFPFGSNNSTYRLTKSMVDCIHQSGFTIYDWTQDTLDGANPNSSPDLILNRAISTDDTVVVLMHTSNININSAKALPGIIKYYKSQGYTFKKITPNTKEIYKITRPNC